jgi:hypothetical protein
MHICFKIIKFLLHSTLLYMFRTLLCPSSGAFHHCTCSLWLPCCVVLVASSSPALATCWLRPPVLRCCYLLVTSSSPALLLLVGYVLQSCSVATCWLRPPVLLCCYSSSNRAGLEDATNTKSHGNQRLHVQWWKAPDDGHSSVRNI